MFVEVICETRDAAICDSLVDRLAVR